jgi:hypothetical protein
MIYIWCFSCLNGGIFTNSKIDYNVYYDGKHYILEIWYFSKYYQWISVRAYSLSLSLRQQNTTNYSHSYIKNTIAHIWYILLLGSSMFYNYWLFLNLRWVLYISDRIDSKEGFDSRLWNGGIYKVEKSKELMLLQTY